MNNSIKIVSENADKVNENSIKEEKNMDKVTTNSVKVEENMIIDDRTDATKAKTKALNSKTTNKGGNKKKKPTKSTKTNKNATKKVVKPIKGDDSMDHKAKLVKILQGFAKKSKDLEVNTLIDRSGAVSTYQLKRGGDNIVTIRKTDILACRPRDFFAESLMNKVPWFSKYDSKSGKEMWTHFVHIKKYVTEDTFTAIVKKAVTSKKTVAEWKKECNAIVKPRASKVTEKERVLRLQESIKRQQEELKVLKSAKGKVAKGSKAKAKKSPATKKAATVLRKKATKAVADVAASIA